MTLAHKMTAHLDGDFAPLPNLDAHLMADVLRESMQQGNVATLTLSSNSMAPLLQAGDQIQIEPITVADLRRGDVVTFLDEQNSAELTTHRFWGIHSAETGIQLIARGDRPLLFDAPFEPRNLIGRVVARQRLGRELRLDSGQGKWLSERLARSSAARLSHTTQLDVIDATDLLSAVAASNATVKQAQPPATWRRRLQTGVNLLLARTVDLLATSAPAATHSTDPS